jgi:hypothetical protein
MLKQHAEASEQSTNLANAAAKQFVAFGLELVNASKQASPHITNKDKKEVIHFSTTLCGGRF